MVSCMYDILHSALISPMYPYFCVTPYMQVLDDEAEMFVVKLWRLLIYETEAKHLGIAKSY